MNIDIDYHFAEINKKFRLSRSYYFVYYCDDNGHIQNEGVFLSEEVARTYAISLFENEGILNDELQKYFIFVALGIDDDITWPGINQLLSLAKDHKGFDANDTYGFIVEYIDALNESAYEHVALYKNSEICSILKLNLDFSLENGIVGEVFEIKDFYAY